MEEERARDVVERPVPERRVRDVRADQAQAFFPWPGAPRVVEGARKNVSRGDAHVEAA